MFITVEELKTSVLNANLDVEYINPAIYEAEDVYLREILGDRLYTVLLNKMQSETLSGKYLTLVNSYIKPYLTYKVQSILVVPINFKMRNAGVVNQYDQGFTTSTVKDTAYLAEHYDGRAEFYANRLTTYLKQNASDLPEYGYSTDNVTNPTDSQNVTTLYLGGTRKKCGYIPTGGGGGTTGTVDWNDIENRPNFADVATSGDYDDLENKPTIPVVPTNVSAFINDAGYLTQHQSLAGYATENWVQQQGYSTFDGDYNSLSNKPNFATVATTGSYNDLTDKPTMTQVQADWSQTDDTQPDYINNKPDMDDYVDLGTYNQRMQDISNTLADKVDSGNLCTINNERLDTHSNFELVRTDEIATVATSGSYNDLTDKPTIPAAQVQADWQQNDSTQPDYIKNRPSMPSAQIQADWNQTNTSEVDYIKNKPNFAAVATSGDYHDLTHTPTIPAAQVNSDWNANSGVAQILNKPTIPTKTSDLTNDSGFTTFSGDYRDLTNKPTIPAAQVNSDWNASSGVAQILNKPSLAQVATSGDYRDLENTPNFAAVATSGDYHDLKHTPTIPAAQVNSDWNASSGVEQILNKPTLATVATSGDYDDLSNKPSFAAVATSGDYDDLENKPEIPSVGNANIDVNVNNTRIARFTTNQSTNGSIDLTIPTKTSDLTNDSNYITIRDVPAQTQSDWNQSDSTAVDFIKNKPTIPTVGDGTITIKQGNITKGSFTTNQTGNTTITIDEGGQFSQQQADWSQTDSTAVDFIKNKPTIPAAQVNSDWNASSGVEQILNKPTLATVATSGDYRDLENKPTLTTVARTGSYNDLTDKPTLPSVNNGSLTIQKNGTTVATFTANDSSNKTANITVPTNETDLGLTTETWTFTLSDNSTVTKTVVIK